MTYRHICQHDEIFVFGSNEAGRHGAGAALTALQMYGALYGKGVGLAGRSYAIPTKDRNIRTLPLDDIKVYVDQFIKVAEAHEDVKFFITALGTGLAGYSHQDMAPLFKNAPSNCRLPAEWR